MANLAKNLSNSKEENFQLDLNWKENPAVKKLLDAIASSLAEEYIETAKQNPDIFTK
jgi:hypothetical protein